MTKIKNHMPITLEADCVGHRVPTGEMLNIPIGTTVFVTQCIGDSVTVNVGGNLVKLTPESITELGLEPEESPVDVDQTLPVKEQVREVLKTCYDPEIPVNIVDLGLIYGVNIEPAEQHPDKHRAHVAMTLTAPGCGMGPIIVEEAKHKICQLDAIQSVQVEMVFDPPWTQDLMTEAAKLELGLL